MITVHSTLAFEEFLMWFAILGILCTYCGIEWFVAILNHSSVFKVHARVVRKNSAVSGVHNLNCLKTITLFHVVNNRTSPTGIKCEENVMSE